MKILLWWILFLFLGFGDGFCNNRNFASNIRLTRLSMGRASVVRAETKSKTDQHKCLLYNRHAQKILTAISLGKNSDAKVNSYLAKAIEEAKSANVPSAIIDRNIKKASMSLNSANYNDIHELIGPAGSFILVHTCTNNRNRAASSIYLVSRDNGARNSPGGSVLYQFNKMCKISFPSSIEEEKIAAILNDLDIEKSNCQISINEKFVSDIAVPMDCSANFQAALKSHINASLDSVIVFTPKFQKLNLEGLDLSKFQDLIMELLSLEDVSHVDHNVDDRYRT